MASRENAENVVNPPNMPVARNILTSLGVPERRARKPINIPIASDPITLTKTVAQGKDGPNARNTKAPTRYRSPAPIAPPADARRRWVIFSPGKTELDRE